MSHPDFNYHSGSGKTFIGPRSARRNPILLKAESAASQPLLKIRFTTTKWAPNHAITVRSEVDGWGNDTLGVYHEGGWDFFFQKSSLPDELTFKFVLDGEHWMIGSDIVIPTQLDAHFDQSQVRFSGAKPKFQHGYDNFRLEQTKLAQDALLRNTRADVLYDVIVIGSGMGGGILADSLSAAGVKTLVLEAGGLVFPTHIANLSGEWTRLPSHHKVGHFINEAGSGLLPGAQMCLGGRSVYWSGLIPRMHDWELNLWPDTIRAFLSGGGYGPAEKLMRKQSRPEPFSNSVVQKLSDELDGWQVGDLPRSGHQLGINEYDQSVGQSLPGVFSTADALLASQSYDGGSGRDNLSINLGHLVTHIETEGSTANAVFCEDLLGNMTRRYSGRIIVLAAGSLESPRIALNSGFRDFNQKIGRGLTDHPAFYSKKYDIPDDNSFGGMNRHASVFMYKADATVENCPFNVEVSINPASRQIRHASNDAPSSSQLEMKFVFSSFLDDNNFVKSNGIGKKLSVKVNPNGAAVAHFDAARDTRNAILSSLGISHDRDEGMAYGNEGTVHHAGGSMRMSGNDTGVVDTNLKFEAYDNLYCADPSIWPMIPAANPALTLAALVLRLSKHLQGLIGLDPPDS